MTGDDGIPHDSAIDDGRSSDSDPLIILMFHKGGAGWGETILNLK